MARKKMSDENNNAADFEGPPTPSETENLPAADPILEQPPATDDSSAAVAATEPASGSGNEVGVADVASGTVDRAPTSIGSYTPSPNDDRTAGLDDPSKATERRPSELAALQTNAGATIGQTGGESDDPSAESVTLARTCYLAHRHFQNFHSNKHTRVGPIPDFDRLPQDLRLAWEAAARQVRSVVQNPGQPIKPESRWAGWVPPDEPADGPDPRISWNPYTKTVMNHQTGEVDREATDKKRAELGLKVPWSPEIGSKEVHEAPAYDRNAQTA